MIKRIALYLLALIMMGFGIALYLKPVIGVGSWDVLHSNLAEFIPVFSYGTWVIIVGVFAITVSLAFKFDLKSYAAVVSGIINGLFIDLFIELLDQFSFSENYLIKLIIFIIAIIFLGAGIALLVLTKLPPTPADTIMLGLSHRFKLNFTISKTIAEVSVFIVAIIISFIGGKPFLGIGLGTILTTLLIGLIIGYFSKIWRKLFNLSIDK